MNEEQEARIYEKLSTAAFQHITAVIEEIGNEEDVLFYMTQFLTAYYVIDSLHANSGKVKKGDRIILDMETCKKIIAGMKEQHVLLGRLLQECLNEMDDDPNRVKAFVSQIPFLIKVTHNENRH